ncbi:similar to Saccharomyces cerevisiae YBR008C FLR1 Plasma membrane multidrug transporter of the major facilitator superfamily [Maudiozyma saulgeensis]|uniref:Similar to Saccharomyces cerevisiae YBR008C FLR1 Plasma membrane multidrug transporter of the major facilitator superfamily n=1 Tax=Maudiozyma saulgeensis TaxID=1789683 RepID=A0A1X7R6Y7_9SACH|nr:similar to Saccharomyces cerevisiae YBR008C FLR1 Plasma membrane multidrug transporter of the major facilitator superfamily [Kazachstania saulgeensis]
MSNYATFKNTFFFDILEFLNIIKISELHNLKNTIDLESTSLEVSSHEDSSESDIEKGSESDSIRKNDQTVQNKELKNDPFLIDWTGPDDPENPQNWSNARKYFIMFQIMLLTAVTYMGSSIYTPGEEGIREEFKVGHVVATLNMSLYVLGYGLGPIVLSPITDIAKIGRQQVYTYTLFFFMIFQIAIASVHNIGGLIVMRFITGVLCSPALATGGATIVDVMKQEIVPVFLGFWSVGAIVAPIIAPILGASMVIAKNWRWIFWLLTWMSAFTLIILVFFFKETSATAILSRRARRIRRETGDDRYYTLQEKKDSESNFWKLIGSTLYSSIKIILLEPIVLAFDVYCALAYGSFYLFFESFPIVFSGIYNFTLIELGLSFMGFAVGGAIAFVIFLTFLVKVLFPKFQNGTFVPETYLILLMWVCWCFPFAILLFGWAAGTHWIVPIIAEVFFVICCFNLFQVTFSYLAFAYPNHTAAVFAGNGLFRAGFACSMPLFGQAMYNNLAIDGYPVGWGSTIVAFFTIFLCIVPFVLYKYGASLRAKSRFVQ